MLYRRGRKQFSDRKGTFDPKDTRRVKHTKLGVWDLYEEREPKLSRIPGSVKLERYLELFEGLPYVWRMIKDVLSIPTCAFLLLIYALVELGQAIFPAAGLWYDVFHLTLHRTGELTGSSGIKDNY